MCVYVCVEREVCVYLLRVKYVDCIKCTFMFVTRVLLPENDDAKMMMTMMMFVLVVGTR